MLRRTIIWRPIPWEDWCCSCIKLCFVGNSRVIIWEVVCSYMDKKQGLLTSVTFPSLTVQFWITSLIKGEAIKEWEVFFQEFVFVYQKRYSWFLVYFLLFLRWCNLLLLLPVWVEFPLVTPDLAWLSSCISLFHTESAVVSARKFQIYVVWLHVLQCVAYSIHMKIWTAGHHHKKVSLVQKKKWPL